MEGVLLQATIYLTAMVIAVPLSVRLGLGSVLGYLIAGIAIGPILGIVGSETQDLQHYAEFGVVLMLFLIGLELDPKALWNMRKKLLGVGGAQIVLSTVAIAAAANSIGLPLGTALAVGITLALSSTAIVLTTLTEKGLMRTEGGTVILLGPPDAGYRRHPRACAPAAAGGAGHGRDFRRRIDPARPGRRRSPHHVAG
jgi:CPA2 family monovalent cation:H+ antiporter-2